MGRKCLGLGITTFSLPWASQPLHCLGGKLWKKLQVEASGQKYSKQGHSIGLSACTSPRDLWERGVLWPTNYRRMVGRQCAQATGTFSLWLWAPWQAELCQNASGFANPLHKATSEGKARASEHIEDWPASVEPWNLRQEAFSQTGMFRSAPGFWPKHAGQSDMSSNQKLAVSERVNSHRTRSIYWGRIQEKRLRLHVRQNLRIAATLHGHTNKFET